MEVSEQKRFCHLITVYCTSETSVDFYQTTWHNIPEDSHHHHHHHHTRRRENLKSHQTGIDFCKRHCLSRRTSNQVLITHANFTYNNVLKETPVSKLIDS
jgi:hypothetical protein